MPSITHATPRNINLGVDDQSTVTVPVSREGTPQHLPIFFLFTQKGSYEKTKVTGNNFGAFFGSKSLDPRSKYFTHASQIAKSVLSAGGQIVVQRLKITGVA